MLKMEQQIMYRLTNYMEQVMIEESMANDRTFYNSKKKQLSFFF
jgi:hypothetical protein